MTFWTEFIDAQADPVEEPITITHLLASVYVISGYIDVTGTPDVKALAGLAHLCEQWANQIPDRP